jgi:hypothetical protein
VAHQEILRAGWQTKEGLWLVRRGCGGFMDQPAPLPVLSHFRDPPDPIGPQPLRWLSPPPASGFRIEVRHSPRASAARVYSAGEEDRWIAEWAGFP